MTEGEETVLADRLARAETLESSGIGLEQVRELWRSYQLAMQHDMGSELGARVLELAHHHMLKPGATAKVLACSVQGISGVMPKAIVDVRLEVTQ